MLSLTRTPVGRLEFEFWFAAYVLDVPSDFPLSSVFYQCHRLCLCHPHFSITASACQVNAS